ncbi:unnamed protein product, partial [Ectocarpus sp. 8 AP-2014]
GERTREGTEPGLHERPTAGGVDGRQSGRARQVHAVVGLRHPAAPAGARHAGHVRAGAVEDAGNLHRGVREGLGGGGRAAPGGQSAVGGAKHEGSRGERSPDSGISGLSRLRGISRPFGGCRFSVRDSGGVQKPD